MARRQNVCVTSAAIVLFFWYLQYSWKYLQETPPGIHVGVSSEIANHVKAVALLPPTAVVEIAKPVTESGTTFPVESLKNVQAKLPYGRPSPLLIDSNSGYSMSPDLPQDLGYEPRCTLDDGNRQVLHPGDKDMAPEFKSILMRSNEQAMQWTKDISFEVRVRRVERMRSETTTP